MISTFIQKFYIVPFLNLVCLLTVLMLAEELIETDLFLIPLNYLLIFDFMSSLHLMSFDTEHSI